MIDAGVSNPEVQDLGVGQNESIKDFKSILLDINNKIIEQSNREWDKLPENEKKRRDSKQRVDFHVAFRAYRDLVKSHPDEAQRFITENQGRYPSLERAMNNYNNNLNHQETPDTSDNRDVVEHDNGKGAEYNAGNAAGEAEQPSSEERFDEEVAYLDQRAEAAGSSTADDLNQIVQEGVEGGQHPDQAQREQLLSQLSEIKRILIERHLHNFQEMIKQNQEQQLIESLKQLTVASPEDILLLKGESEGFDIEILESFLSEKLKDEVIIDALARFTEAEAVLRQSQETIEDIDSHEDANKDESISEKPRSLDVFTDWYAGYAEGSEEFLDKDLDFMSIMRLVFDIEDSSSWNSYKDGLESKDDSKESQTLDSLAKVFLKQEHSIIFLHHLIGKPNEHLSITELIEEVNNIVSLENVTNPKERIEQLKGNMSEGFVFLEKTSNLSLSVTKSDQINLSADVMKFLMLNTHNLIHKQNEKSEN